MKILLFLIAQFRPTSHAAVDRGWRGRIPVNAPIEKYKYHAVNRVAQCLENYWANDISRG